MKVFISGPMSGKPYYNRTAFYKAQEELEKHGYSVWNPAWLAYPNDTEFTKDDMHIIDFAALRRCDAIYMLKGWKYSKGAQEEREYAEMRGLMIMYEGACCWGKESEKNTPVFDREFAYYDSIKNRTNYQLKAIKGNIRAKYAELKEITKNLDIGLGNESDRINSLEGEVEAIKESIGTDNLQEQLEKDFADVYEEFQNTKDQVNDINMGYINWSSEVSQFDERIEKLEENMKKIAANGGLGLSFNLMNEHVSSNKRDISSIKNDIATIKDSIDNQRCTLDVISERVDKHYKKHNDNDDALEKRIKDMNVRMGLFGKEIDKLKTAIDIPGKDTGSIAQKRCDDNKVVNNTLSTIDICLDDLNNRLKAIEKRLNIKPFYAPTEDEKDDD